ncbi:restriction endonuclease [Aestuariivirga sp.]|uniref:restriction endonuclease n=1 Tax=Aestuariivirga sp. TaxID=2650926 RepID=UPI0039E37F77
MLSEYQRLMWQWQQDESASSPEENSHPFGAELTSAYSSYFAEISQQLIAAIHVNEPAFFEALIIDVMLAMGYGGRRRDMAKRLGRTGDGGVDGLISLDFLGLDLVYLQAKRLKPGHVVPITDVRDFAGSLDAHHTGKGIFVTTSHFSPQALDFCARLPRRIALVDGKLFAELMLRHNIGVHVQASYQFKRIDRDYFRLRSREPAGPR